ncbi:uncharacterized protein LOC126834958, partial [Adelges cooleyi]|uniref:uncharacterized protein LOC126834958 n=1 Tax=Adelges cooleyi TaxID=133065 RepID=UPI00217F5910
MTTTVEVTSYNRRPLGHGDMASIMGGRGKQSTLAKSIRRATPIPVLPPRIPTPMPKPQKEDVSKLEIAKYEKSYRSSLATHLKLYKTDASQNKGDTIYTSLQQRQTSTAATSPRPPPPLPPPRPTASGSTACASG